jgi:hypothetical protein
MYSERLRSARGCSPRQPGAQRSPAALAKRSQFVRTILLQRHRQPFAASRAAGASNQAGVERRQALPLGISEPQAVSGTVDTLGRAFGTSGSGRRLRVAVDIDEGERAGLSRRALLAAYDTRRRGGAGGGPRAAGDRLLRACAADWRCAGRCCSAGPLRLQPQSVLQGEVRHALQRRGLPHLRVRQGAGTSSRPSRDHGAAWSLRPPPARSAATALHQRAIAGAAPQPKWSGGPLPRRSGAAQRTSPTASFTSSSSRSTSTRASLSSQVRGRAPRRRPPAHRAPAARRQGCPSARPRSAAPPGAAMTHLPPSADRPICRAPAPRTSQPRLPRPQQPAQPSSGYAAAAPTRLQAPTRRCSG